MRETVSIDLDLAELEVFTGRGTGPPLLIEVPHGATEAKHYRQVEEALESPLPADLIEFFWVNTDQGAPELARWVAKHYVRQGGSEAVVLRSLLPRTFVDCNRLLQVEDNPLTPGLPPWIATERDRELLVAAWSRYRECAVCWYEEILGRGHGWGLMAHTFAPRSVAVEVDHSIVEVMRRAYEPAAFAAWPQRPLVDLITRPPGSEHPLSPPGLEADLRSRYRAMGVEAAANATYRLHPSTVSWEHSCRFPGRILCVELNRDELATGGFDPFVPNLIDPAAVRRLGAPVVEAFAALGHPSEAEGGNPAGGDIGYPGRRRPGPAQAQENSP